MHSVGQLKPEPCKGSADETRAVVSALVGMSVGSFYHGFMIASILVLLHTIHSSHWPGYDQTLTADRLIQRSSTGSLDENDDEMFVCHVTCRLG